MLRQAYEHTMIYAFPHMAILLSRTMRDEAALVGARDGMTALGLWEVVPDCLGVSLLSTCI